MRAEPSASIAALVRDDSCCSGSSRHNSSRRRADNGRKMPCMTSSAGFGGRPPFRVPSVLPPKLAHRPPRFPEIPEEPLCAVGSWRIVGLGSSRGSQSKKSRLVGRRTRSADILARVRAVSGSVRPCPRWRHLWFSAVPGDRAERRCSRLLSELPVRPRLSETPKTKESRRRKPQLSLDYQSPASSPALRFRPPAVGPSPDG
jgi:hypothetical protein